MDNGILLDTGTNELEIVEFIVGNVKFGINVIKVREIINPLPITPIPQSHRNVEGIIELRGEVLPVVNVATALGIAPSTQPEYDKYIVTEFNQVKIVFHVHNVTQIHRISWTQIEKPNEMYQGLETQITGVVKFDGEMILLLDFEKMIVDINPETSIKFSSLKRLGERERSDKHVMVVEDSPLLRKLLEETLTEAGYVNCSFYENGREALDYLLGIIDQGRDVKEVVQLVITDIEMPQMDGHHLTKRIKENDRLNELPVLIFSSLITGDLRHKGEMVGANGQVSKPEIVELIELIDQHIL
jgi:two-component system, chemotaxis family, chemotaxis protein CheV